MVHPPSPRPKCASCLGARVSAIPTRASTTGSASTGARTGGSTSRGALLRGARPSSLSRPQCARALQARLSRGWSPEQGRRRSRGQMAPEQGRRRSRGQMASSAAVAIGPSGWVPPRRCVRRGFRASDGGVPRSRARVRRAPASGGQDAVWRRLRRRWLWTCTAEAQARVRAQLSDRRTTTVRCCLDGHSARLKTIRRRPRWFAAEGAGAPCTSAAPTSRRATYTEGCPHTCVDCRLRAMGAEGQPAESLLNEVVHSS